MIDSDVEEISYCGSLEEAMQKLGEKGRKIWMRIHPEDKTEPVDYKKLLEKYMRDVVECEGTAFVEDEWCGGFGLDDYTEKENAALVELRNKIYKQNRG